MNRLSVITLVAAAALAHAAALHAQAAPMKQPDPWTELGFTSSILGEHRSLLVAVPDDYATATRSYPVLVLLDADDAVQFRSALTTVRFLSDRRAIPPLIVVGVVNGADRTRDMTPSPGTEGLAQFPTGGGAARFLDFLTDEALPRVRDRYRTAKFTVLAGHSFGGLFALWVAATHRDTFPAMIALSPSLWWNDSSVVRPFGDSIAGGGAHLRLFVADGGHEPTIAGPTSRFNALLDERPSPLLAFAHLRFASASHGLVPLPGLVEGLQFIFQPVSLAVTRLDDIAPFSADSAQLVDLFREIEHDYMLGVRSFPASSLGMSDTLPEAYVRDYAGEALFLTHRPGPAAVILRRAAELYPRSAGVHMDLAHIFLTAADTTRARAELMRAAALAAGDSTMTRLVTDAMGTLGGVK